MSGTAAEVRDLIDMLAYPEGDVRVLTGELALEIAEAIDDGATDIDGFVHGPLWLLDYVLHDLTFRPNRPHNLLEEIRYRCARGWWESRQRWIAEHGDGEPELSSHHTPRPESWAGTPEIKETNNEGAQGGEVR